MGRRYRMGYRDGACYSSKSNLVLTDGRGACSIMIWGVLGTPASGKMQEW